MFKISFDDLKAEFQRILLSLAFSNEKAELCADIFASNSRDGVYSHGLNRFPVFVEYVQEGLVLPGVEPAVVSGFGAIESWDGNLAPGIYTATLAMRRAVELSAQFGIGCVAVKNTNHWMRGGTYGWQAADAGFIGICITNL